MNAAAEVNQQPAATPWAARAGNAMRMAQLAALHLLVFSLPLLEAPKNAACGLVAVFWALRTALTRAVGGRWDRFDTAFALAIAAALASAISNQYYDGIADVARIALVAWIVKRSPLSRGDVIRLLFTATLALWLALAIGYVDYNAGRTPYLQLPSVGHVNQSSLYMALLALLTFCWALDDTAARSWRIYTGASATFFGVSLLVTASRAAILAYGAALVLLATRHLGSRRIALSWRRVLAACALVLAVVAGGFLVSGSMRPDAERLRDKLLVTSSVAQRWQHWRLAIEGWHASPIFGRGPESFRALTPQQACAWRAERNAPCNLDDYSSASHPHSLYLAALVERGLFGLCALLYLLWIWFFALLRAGDDFRKSQVWAASAAGLVVVAVGGLFNTTLRVEHGTLAMLLLSFWLASSRDARAGVGAAPNDATSQHQPR